MKSNNKIKLPKLQLAMYLLYPSFFMAKAYFRKKNLFYETQNK